MQVLSLQIVVIERIVPILPSMSVLMFAVVVLEKGKGIAREFFQRRFLLNRNDK